MKFIPIIAILAIIIRIAFFYAIQGVHEPKYFAQAEYIRDSSQFIIIGYLLNVVMRKQTDYCRLIIKFGIIFCYLTPCVLLLYGFLPDSVTIWLPAYIFGYFTIWSMVAICLGFYYVHCLKGDLLA